MELKTETINFLTFVIVGIIIGIIFDFFRALRKVKKCSIKVVYIQDIIFFILVGLVISMVLIHKLQYNLRIYLFLAILIGVVIYISTLSNIIIKIFITIIKMSRKILMFVILPFQVWKECFKHINNKIFVRTETFLSKIIKKCCNKFFYVISYICSKKNLFLKKVNFKKR